MLLRAAARQAAAAGQLARRCSAAAGSTAAASSAPPGSRRLVLPDGAIVLPMPALSPSMTHGRVARWLKAVGDSVAEYDLLLEVGTESLVEEGYRNDEFAGEVVLSLEAQEEAVVAALLVPEGASVPVGAPIALLAEEPGQAAAVAAAAAATAAALRDVYDEAAHGGVRTLVWQSYLIASAKAPGGGCGPSTPRFLDSPRFAADSPFGRQASGFDLGGAPDADGPAPSLDGKLIILPDGAFRTAWMQVQLAVAMYIVWVTPDALTGDIVTDHRSIARRYLCGWFAIDLLATLPVDYVVRAVEVTPRRAAGVPPRGAVGARSRARPRARAAQGTWACSLRGDCSWSVVGDGSVSVVGLLRLLRFFRVVWILKHVKFMHFSVVLGDFADDLYAILPLLSILELVIILLYLGHVSGCFFYLLSTPPWQTKHEQALIASGEMTTWMSHAFGGDKVLMMPTPLEPPPPAGAPPPRGAALDAATGRWWLCPDWGYAATPCPGCAGPRLRCASHYGLAFRYVTSMYWAYTTMTTVGSTTLAEKLWAITTMIVSGFFFSFVVGRMASLVAKLDSHRTAVNEKLEVVTTFLKDVELPRHLARRVLDMFRKQKIKPYDRGAVLAALPFELRAKVLRHLYAGAIASVPLLRALSHDELFLSDACSRLQPYNCSAETYVYQRGESGGDVFILLRGELHVLDLDATTCLAKIPEGSVFGEGTVLRHMEARHAAQHGAPCAPRLPPPPPPPPPPLPPPGEPPPPARLARSAAQGGVRAKRSENLWCKTACYMLRLAQEDMADLLESYPSLTDTLRALHRDRHRDRRRLAQKAGGGGGGDGAQAPGDTIPALRGSSGALDGPSPPTTAGSSMADLARGPPGGTSPGALPLGAHAPPGVKEHPLLRPADEQLAAQAEGGGTGGGSAVSTPAGQQPPPAPPSPAAARARTRCARRRGQRSRPRAVRAPTERHRAAMGRPGKRSAAAAGGEQQQQPAPAPAAAGPGGSGAEPQQPCAPDAAPAPAPSQPRRRGGGAGGGAAGEPAPEPEQAPGAAGLGAPPRPKKKRKLLSEEKLRRLKEATARRGIVYVSRLPPHMKPAKLRQLLSPYGEVGRIYCTPEDAAARKQRKKNGGNSGKNFTEGWVEFEDKAVAKRVAGALNGQPMGGSRRSAYHYDLWALRYLPKFKWDHLTEEVTYERAVREQRLAAELGAARRERDAAPSVAAPGAAAATAPVKRSYGQRKVKADPSQPGAAAIGEDVLSMLVGGGGGGAAKRPRPGGA
ncbi:esf2 [Scenedesmus sp. PABB004]|nr:esf2 [Scenedesmus sp. PABB004]